MTAKAIETWGVEGALKLIDRYPYDFFVALFNRTQQLRRPSDEIEAEESLEDTIEWLESAPDKTIQIPFGDEILDFNPKHFLPANYAYNTRRTD